MKRWRAADGSWRGLRVVDAVGGGEADLYLYDAIDSWGGEWGVSAKEVVAALATVRAATLNVHLNSPGGDYFEGVAIRTALVGHAATVNIFVDGLAASAASVVATAGERVVIAQGGQIMIHEARTIQIGTADDMRGTADVLDKIGDDIAGMYAARAGGEVAEWRGLMRAETWFTADEAVAAGLADELAAGPARPDEPEEPDEPDEDEPAGARAAARWVQQWRHPGRDAAPAPENPAAPAAAAPPAAAAAHTPKVDPELFRSAIREGSEVTRTVIPTDAAELEEMLGDSARMQALFADTAAFGEFITNYARSQIDRDNSIADQVRDETQRVLAQFLRDNPDALVRPNLTPDALQPATLAEKCANYNRRAPGARVDQMLAEGGDGADLMSLAGRFLRNTWHGNRSAESATVRERLDRIRNDFGSTVPADGGFLIPETLRAQLLRIALETAVVRPRARVIPMESLTVPFPTVDSTSNASTVYGGVTAYWTEESGQLQETSAKFGRIKLEAKKLTAYTEVPNELFTDSIVSLEAFINEIFPEALAWFEDIAFMRGTGVGEPLGFLHAGNGAAVSVAKESGQGADTIVWENLVKMFARMLPTSLGRSVWIANLDTFPELATMALSVGTGGSAIWLNNGVEGPPMSILGRPVVFTEKADTLGDAGDINLVDLGYYLIGDRQAVQAATSPHYRFQNDQTAIRFIERVDGRPWIQSAITPNKGANTLSPFVRLAARA